MDFSTNLITGDPEIASVKMVLKTIVDSGLTFHSFVYGVFTLDDDKIKRVATHFYSHSHHARLLDCWINHIQHDAALNKHMDPLVESSAGIVIAKVRKQVEALAHDRQLRLGSITVDAIKKFSLRFVRERMELKAPLLLRFLDGIVSIGKGRNRERLVEEEDRAEDTMMAEDQDEEGNENEVEVASEDNEGEDLA
ncbi:hypothetical protein BGZ82_009710, partial [Podila clonocystis]